MDVSRRASRAFSGCAAPARYSRLTRVFLRRGASTPISWREGTTRYEILVSNPERRCRGVREAVLDGAPVDARAVPLQQDGGTHSLRIVLGDRKPDQSSRTDEKLESAVSR